MALALNYTSGLGASVERMMLRMSPVTVRRRRGARHAASLNVAPSSSTSAASTRSLRRGLSLSSPGLERDDSAGGVSAATRLRAELASVALVHLREVKPSSSSSLLYPSGESL